MINNKAINNTAKVFRNLPVYVLAIIWLFPFLLLLTSTFKEPDSFFNFAELPNFTYFDYYLAVFKKINILRPLLMSIILTVSTMAITIVFGSMAGYSLGRSREKTFSYIYLIGVNLTHRYAKLLKTGVEKGKKI